MAKKEGVFRAEARRRDVRGALVDPLMVVPGDLAAALGRFVIAFAQAERIWTVGPGRLKGWSLAAKTMNHKSANARKLGELRDAFAEACVPLDCALAQVLLTHMASLVERADALARRRNMLVHGFWHINAAGHVVVKNPGEDPIVDPKPALLDGWTAEAQRLFDEFQAVTKPLTEDGDRLVELTKLAQAIQGARNEVS